MYSVWSKGRLMLVDYCVFLLHLDGRFTKNLTSISLKVEQDFAWITWRSRTKRFRRFFCESDRFATIECWFLCKRLYSIASYCHHSSTNKRERKTIHASHTYTHIHARARAHSCKSSAFLLSFVRKQIVVVHLIKQDQIRMREKKLSVYFSR